MLVNYENGSTTIARNYPESEAVRSVVPAKDVIRYALGRVMDLAATSEDSKQIFLALGQHFAVQGQLDLFATQILDFLRGDSRPQLIHRVDSLLDLLARSPKPVTRSPTCYRTRARLAIKNACSTNICQVHRRDPAVR